METNVNVNEAEKKCSTWKKVGFIMSGVVVAGAGIYLANRFGLLKVFGKSKSVETVEKAVNTANNAFSNGSRVAGEVKKATNFINKGGVKL